MPLIYLRCLAAAQCEALYLLMYLESTPAALATDLALQVLGRPVLPSSFLA